MLIDLLAPCAGERILDIGCGLGQQAGEIASRGADVTGIDPSKILIEQARTANPRVRFEVARLGHYQPEWPFDALFTRGVLHWVKPAPEAAQALYRLLKPGGRMAAEIGCHGAGLTPLESETWLSALRGAGFEVVFEARLDDGRLRVSARRPE